MVLILGISGFIGRALAALLVEKGIPVCGVSRSSFNLLISSKLIKVYAMDEVTIDKIFTENKIEHVVNLSVCYGRFNETIIDLDKANVKNPLYFYKKANFYGCKSFMQVDSFLQKQENQSNNSDYIRTKNKSRKALLQIADQTALCFAQLEHVYGPNDNEHKLFGSVIDRYSRGINSIKVGYCDLWRDLIYIDDVVELLFLIMINYRLCKNRVVEVGTGKMTTLREALEVLRISLIEFNPERHVEIDYGPWICKQLLASQANLTFVTEKLDWCPRFNLEYGMRKLIRYDRLITGE